MSGVGTWRWAEATGGRLRRRDRAELLRQVVALRLAAMRRRGAAAGLPATLPEPPDSVLAREAEELVRDVSAPPLHAHCVRTWAFAAMLGERDRVGHDPELLYLACLLHDLGLADEHDRRDPASACFGVEGARAAEAFMRSHGEPGDRARLVAEAISLHLNVRVPERLGGEAHLLSRAASIDVTGVAVGDLSREETAAVTGRWPRDGWADYVVPAIARQAEARPRSRAAFLVGLGFERMVRANPLDRSAPASPHAEAA